MRIGSTACFILAAVSAVGAFSVIGRGNLPGGIANNVGYVVGLSVIPAIFLIGGLAARKSSKSST